MSNTEKVRTLGNIYDGNLNDFEWKLIYAYIDNNLQKFKTTVTENPVIAYKFFNEITLKGLSLVAFDRLRKNNTGRYKNSLNPLASTGFFLTTGNGQLSRNPKFEAFITEFKNNYVPWHVKTTESGDSYYDCPSLGVTRWDLPDYLCPIPKSSSTKWKRVADVDNNTVYSCNGKSLEPNQEPRELCIPQKAGSRTRKIKKRRHSRTRKV